ncbi:hypothetical protein ES703_57785 [subsurface metagenome]
MKCPKCGTENPDDAQICRSCGYVPKSDAADKPVAKPKTSRLAIASLVLSIFGLFTFLITAVLSIALGITSLCRIKKHKPELKGKCIAVTGIIISAVSILVFVSVFVLWSLDAPPISDDYTIADLRSAPPECNRSYELLMSLSEEQECPPDAPKIGLSEQDVNTIEQVNEVIKESDYSKITETLKANADSINQAWENAKKGRDVINELNTFPEMADLTEPDLDVEMKLLRNLRHLVYLYQAYVYLQTEQGKTQIAVNELIELDSVFRKLSVNVRPMVTKLVCIAGLANNIFTANFIVNNPQTSPKSLEILAEHFKPFTREQTSLQNSIISEYLACKKALDTYLGRHVMRTPMLKRNSTFRLAKNICDNLLDIMQESPESKNSQLSVWPVIHLNWMPVSLDSEHRLPWYYTCYNPVGSVIVQIVAPSYERIFQIKTRLQIHSDLLQIVLNKRLGKQVSLKARAYGDEYIIDVEKKRIFSPGPDGEADTKDGRLR